MQRLRDSSEVREAAELLGAILEQTPPRGSDQAARGVRLARILREMCARAGFAGAAITDARGLPLATHALPFPMEAAGALTAILGDVLTRVADMTSHADASSVAIELGYFDKLVVRRFAERDAIYFLLVVCPARTEERAEIELSIDEISSLVGKV